MARKPDGKLRGSSDEPDAHNENAEPLLKYAVGLKAWAERIKWEKHHDEEYGLIVDPSGELNTLGVQLERAATFVEVNASPAIGQELRRRMESLRQSTKAFEKWIAEDERNEADQSTALRDEYVQGSRERDRELAKAEWDHAMERGTIVRISLGRTPRLPITASDFANEIVRVMVDHRHRREKAKWELAQEGLILAVHVRSLATCVQDPARNGTSVQPTGDNLEADAVKPQPTPADDAMSNEAKALAMLAEHSDWTKTKIADAIGVHRGTLARFPRFTAAWDTMKDAGKEHRRDVQRRQAGNDDDE